MREFLKSVLAAILRFFKVCAKQLELVVAISALVFTMWATHKANLQFQDNAEYADSTFNLQLQKSDSLFNAQMNYEKALNDSLVNVIRDLQTINDRQLSVLKTTQKENIDSDKPYFNFLGAERVIIDTLNNGNIVFDVQISMVNGGNRMAINTISRDFIFYNEFKDVFIQESLGTMNIAAKQESTGASAAVLPQKYINDFYVITEIRFMDEKLNEWHTQYNFAHYYKPSQYDSHYGFYICEYEKDRILPYIDIELKKIKDGFYRFESGTYIPKKQ